MSPQRAGLWVGGIFGAVVVINLASLLVAEHVEAISSADLNALMMRLGMVYAAPVVAVGAGVWAKRGAAGRTRPGPLWAAIVVCGIWNGLLVAKCLQFAIAAFSPTAFGGLRDLQDYFETVSRFTAIVIAAITYLFARPE